MHALRTTRLLASCVLAWFALVVSAATLAPLVQPQGLLVVCSSTGLVTVPHDDGGTPDRVPTLDCPLCASTAPPPMPVVAQVPPPLPLAHALRPVASAHIAALTAAPLPPRGPPPLS